MAAYLFEVERKNRLEQKGLLKRFSLDCYGKQPTMEDIRAEKAKKYEELKGSKSRKSEFESLFFKYSPATSGLKRAKPKLTKSNTLTPNRTRVLSLDQRVSAAYSSTNKTKKRGKKKAKEDGPYARRVFKF
jgi:hypothetical protein